MIRAFFIGLLAGVALLWGLERLTAPTTDELRALERHERALARQLQREREAVARDTETVTRVIGEWPDLRVALADPALPAALKLRVVTWGDNLTAGCSLLVRDCTAALATSDSLAGTLREERDDWRRLARGRFLRPSAELGFSGSLVRGALDVEAGRDRMAFLRVERDTATRVWVGGRFRF